MELWLQGTRGERTVMGVSCNHRMWMWTEVDSHQSDGRSVLNVSENGMVHVCFGTHGVHEKSAVAECTTNKLGHSSVEKEQFATAFQAFKLRFKWRWEETNFLFWLNQSINQFQCCNLHVILWTTKCNTEYMCAKTLFKGMFNKFRCRLGTAIWNSNQNFNLL